MSLSLTARLLCAARHTYSIAAGGPVPDCLPYSAAVGYAAAPEGFVSGPEAIDACLVGETDDGIIVAFRGTMPPDSPNHAQVVRDWANDADALLIAEPEFGGMVHQGFLGSLNDLWAAAAAAIQLRAAQSPTKPIYVVGHSKGGAMANLAAVRCVTAFPTNPVIVCTFAAARSGDDNYAAAYARVVTNSTRYEYADDIVPHLPPSDAFFVMFQGVPFMADILPNLTRGYVSVGELHFIDWTGRVIPDHPGLRFERFASLAKLMLTFGFQTIVGDHSIELGHGYADALCPGLAALAVPPPAVGVAQPGPAL